MTDREGAEHQWDLPVAEIFRKADHAWHRVHLRRVLNAHCLDPRFVDEEIGSMGVGRFAKTANRSILGVMNEFAFLGRLAREDQGDEPDLVALSVFISETPTSPLYKRHISPDRELQALAQRSVG